MLCVLESIAVLHISVFIKLKSSGLDYYFNLYVINFSFSLKQSPKMSMEFENCLLLCPQMLEDTLAYVLKN